MESLFRDVRHAVRSLFRAPTFTLTAILTLAIGIGATVTIFGAVRAVLLQPLPFTAPADLVQLAARTTGSEYHYFSPPNFVDIQRESAEFAELAALAETSTALTGDDGNPEQVVSAAVTGSFFGVLAVDPVVGRAIRPDDAAAGADQVVVLSYPLWHRRFGGDPGIVGRTIQLDDQAHQVIGVMPEGFERPLRAELWTPLWFSSDDLSTQRGAQYLLVYGRRKGGFTGSQTDARLAPVIARLREAYPNTHPGLSARLEPLHEAITGSATNPLLVLLATVATVLVVASVNVAGLLLVRGLGRRRELAVRAALGGSAGRLARGLLIESTVLGILGGAAGVVLALWGTRWLAALPSLGVPFLDQTRIDGTVLAFAAILSVVTGLAFGVLPALHAGGHRDRDLAQRIRDGSTGAAPGPGRRRTRDSLVLIQLAGSTTLLVGAALVSQSFLRQSRVDLGFSATSTLTFGLDFPSARYESEASRGQAVTEVVDRLRAIPGVERVGAIMGLPLTGFAFSFSGHTLDGRQLMDQEASAATVQVRIVTPELFPTLGIRVLSGRGIGELDQPGSAPVMVVNETAARRLWPGESPLGRSFLLATRLIRGRETRAGGEVVGVVEDVRSRGPRFPAPPTVYLAYAQYPTSGISIVIRTATDPTDFVRAAQAAVAAMDPNLPVFRVRTGEQLTSNALAEPRLYASVLALFAGATLLLALVGVYGVMAEIVASRTREIGIRIALGADRTRVLSGIIGRGLLLGGLGGLAGLAAAKAGAGLLSTVLFETAPTDFVTYGGCVAVLLVAAVAASYLPARRAARVDPTVALRSD